MQRSQFPDDFIWGVATAAYQIEGAAKRDGRGESVWDRFSHTPGKVLNDDNGDEACGHFDRWKDDLKLIKDLGVDSYRFSVAWPRLFPSGGGSLNQAGLDFYERLVDEMLKLGLKPNLTLYHWDLPQALEDLGGWHWRGTAKAFADYAEVVAKRLGDRVDFWATFNEPQVFIHHGYEYGVHAPGRKENARFVDQCIHHVLLAHGLGMQALRKHMKPGASAGIVWAPAAIWPASGAAPDVEAANRMWRATNDWWMEPILKGAYPEEVLRLKGDDAPRIEAGDMDAIRQDIDLVGLNYYTPCRVAADPSLPPLKFKTLPPPEGAPRPDFPGWEIFAPGLENLIVQFGRRYPGLDLYVTENGTSSLSDAPGGDGKVHDPRRIAYVREHLAHCKRAIDRGAKLKGYYVWSLMDNFEWGFGYSQRFGLIHVDYKTFKRTPKDSYAWYRQAAKEKGFEHAELPELRSGFDEPVAAS